MVTLGVPLIGGLTYDDSVGDGNLLEVIMRQRLIACNRAAWGFMQFLVI
jgi:hypothetical protein